MARSPILEQKNSPDARSGREKADAPPLPRVSIGLPVYNGAATLGRALDSLLHQDWPNFDIVIADDCSADASPDICSDYAHRHPNIRFSRNVRNLGSVGNLRRVVELADGDYFLYASQDDIWAPNFVSRLVREVERMPDAVAAMSAVRSVVPNDEEKAVATIAPADWPQLHGHLANAISVVTKRGRSGHGVKNNMFIHGIVRMAVFREVLRSFPGIFVAERQLVCQLALAGRLVYVDEVLFTKQISTRSLAERQPNDPLVRRKQAARFPHLDYVSAMAVSLLRSRNIPLSRKAFVPIIVGAFLWENVGRRMYHRALAFLRDVLPISMVKALRRLRKSRGGAN